MYVNTYVLQCSFVVVYDRGVDLLWGYAEKYASSLKAVENTGNRGGVTVNDSVDIQYQLSLASSLMQVLTRNQQLSENSLLEVLQQIHRFIGTAPTLLSLLLVRLQQYINSHVSSKCLLKMAEVAIEVMRCGGEKSSVRRNFCCAILCGLYDVLSKSDGSTEMQQHLAEMVIAALTRQAPIVAQRAPGSKLNTFFINACRHVRGT